MTVENRSDGLPSMLSSPLSARIRPVPELLRRHREAQDYAGLA